MALLRVSRCLSYLLFSLFGFFGGRFDIKAVVSFHDGGSFITTASASYVNPTPLPSRFSMRGANGGAAGTAFSFSSDDDSYSILRDAQVTETSCREAFQPFAVVDAGSTGTRVYMFGGVTRACPGEAREVVPDTVRFLVQGKKASSLRSIFDQWLMACLGDGWEETLLLQSSPPETSSKKLASCVPLMRSYAADLVSALKNDMTELLNKTLTFQQQIHAKQLGVAVFFHSTASIRDYQDWFVDGFFTLFRRELNTWRNQDPYHFFSSPDMTRPISGAEEGLFSFLALNFLTGRLEPNAPPPSSPEGKDVSQQLASVIEVGGASAQIVSPLPLYRLQHPFIKQFSLGQDTGLTQWPRLDLISVSFLQLGVASAGGLLLKNTCANPGYLSDGICSNPCYPRGFEQAQCSSGRASISRDTGRVTVNDNPRESRLNTSAMFCSRFNSAISFKPLNELACRANGLDPDVPLKERVAFPKCRMIVGTGDFQKCYAEVERVLLAPKLPIPGNMEASGVGFDNVEQVFRLVSSSSPVHFIGDALVNALKDLHDFGYFGATPILNEKGEVQNRDATYQALLRAAEEYCNSPVDFIEGQGLVLRTPKEKNNNEKRRLDGFNITTCQDIALLYGFLKHMESAEMKPEKFIFRTKFYDEKNPQHINNGMEYGWHLGAILYRVLKKDSWSKIAYESGVGFNLPAARRL